MSSSKKNKSISLFKRLTGSKAKVSATIFDRAIADLTAEVNNGLTEKEIDTLVSYITLTDLPQYRFVAVLRCLVPQTSVSLEATKNVVMWIASNFHSSRKSVINALQWITGLVKYKLTDTEVINGFYQLFVFMLKIEFLCPYVCHLVYLLTKVDDVLRWRVRDALQLRLKNRKHRQIVALLCLYKSLRPEFVPETIPAINVHSVFRSVGWLDENFELARLRNQRDVEERGRLLTKEIMWNDYLVRKGGKRLKIDVIPPVEYVNLGSSLYEKKTQPVLSYNNMINLGCNQLSVDIPCNVLSLLLSTAGHHLITFGNEELQMRLNTTVYFQLQAVFFYRKESPKEKEYFFKQLVAVQKHMQQGIPAVTSFLTDYLLLWNGEDFQQFIFMLLEWTTCNSFEELKSDILDNIHTLFMSSSLETKCLIIATMRRLLLNMFIAASSSGEDPGNANVTLPEFIYFMDRMILLGLATDGDNITLLDECFTFYELVSQLEESSSLPLFTIIPPGVMYRGLFSRVLSFIDRVCGLLIRYKTVHNRKLKELNSRALFTEKFEIINLYATDIINSLWHSCAISNREEGLIFKGMSKKVLGKYVKQVDVDSIFSLGENIALLPHIVNCGLGVSSDEVMEYLDQYYPNVLELQKI